MKFLPLKVPGETKVALPEGERRNGGVGHVAEAEGKKDPSN